MDENERIRRIREMEERMDALEAAAAGLEEALARWEELRPVREELSAYYEGPLWREDLEADEAGLLPEGLKRGVLSEDGLYDLLERADELDGPL